MSYAAQHAAIRERFNDQWADRTPVAWPNVDFTPPNNAAWCRLSINDGDSEHRSMGGDTNIHRHFGTVFVMCFAPVAGGDAASLSNADFACGIFRGWEHTSSGVYFRRPPFVRSLGIDGEKWYQVNVSARFERDTFY